jgi:tRNA pseudouridine13 synthase
LRILRVPRIDKTLGLEVYATDTKGVGGVIRESVEGFVVEEVLVDGSVAKIEKSVESRVLGASALRQRYLLCVLVKRNWDTFVAIKNVAKQLGVDQAQIHIAGIKDAKAVTAQHITIEGVSVEDVSRINVKDIEVRSIGYFRDALSPFYLLGNAFKIRIRAVKHARSAIEKRIMETTGKLDAFGGIPNFFGHQRFGTTRSITHVVGKAIIRGDFEGAAMLFLAQPSAHEHPSSRQAREELRSKQDFKQALHDFPKQLRFERLMLRHLVEKPRDFVGSFKRLPVRLQELFVQAYQSYLFNRFLSGRIRNGFSLNTAEVGDYVVSVERSGLPMIKTGKLVSAGNLAKTNRMIEAKRMRVALPLVGVRQGLSQGASGEIERQILEAEAAKPADFRVDAIPEMSGRGELRAIISPVRDFRVDEISSATKNSSEYEVGLRFMLLRGSYATVVLREIMKPRDPIAAGF